MPDRNPDTTDKEKKSPERRPSRSLRSDRIRPTTAPPGTDHPLHPDPTLAVLLKVEQKYHQDKRGQTDKLIRMELLHPSGTARIVERVYPVQQGESDAPSYTEAEMREIDRTLNQNRSVIASEDRYTRYMTEARAIGGIFAQQ